MKIIKAEYGEKDVTDIIVKNYFKNNVINVNVNNDTMEGDPKPYFEKQLILQIEEDGEIKTIIASENENFSYPKKLYTDYNTLLLTSCNRIEQVLLAISVNKEIIKNPFNLVVADCSTEDLNPESAVRMHVSDDPYNLINLENYNSNWKSIESYVKTIPKIKNFQIVHVSPRMSKQIGEANLISYGLTAGANLGSKHLVKLSGVCHLKYDVFDELDSIVGEKSVTTWKRTGFSQRSTRVFACNPSKLGPKLLSSGWCYWVNDYDFIEKKFEKIINLNFQEEEINHLTSDERVILVDEGVKQKDYRKIIDDNIRKHNLQDLKDPWIQKFYNNQIW